MNNKSLERLTILFEKLGIPIESKSQDKGELMAYCAGIDMIRSAFESNFSQIFADTATGLGLSLFCELLKIDSSLDADEKRTQIARGLSRKYADYTYNEFTDEIDSISIDIGALVLDFYVNMNGTIQGDYSILAKMGRAFENYVPPCTVLSFCGNGLAFDYWDESPYLFEDYDNFNLNFQLLDELV